ncbi:protransforming growth factor alpha [Syngnathoides biaculeatus]|uniref:protransforming growth factor alpha n=1 Tax=Syngnathoides biaculeatus TaxID=300417 RepID=UPI002ADD58F8|nr:protransforming growth factor alpha [Syngnathoides biaculeatus]
MTRILWDVIFLISGALVTIGAVDATAALNTSGSRHAAASATGSSNFSFGTEASRSDSAVSVSAGPTSIAYASTSSSLTTTATISNILPAKKFVAAAVRSHFDDCPDSHRHFCFHGTCRFLILEETPACICHSGFVGMRCEHADLLAVVATKHHQQTVATVLVLCVIGCVLIIVVCTLLNCWWRQECRNGGRAHHFITEKSVHTQKHRAPCCPSESVV